MLSAKQLPDMCGHAMQCFIARSSGKCPWQQPCWSCGSVHSVNTDTRCLRCSLQRTSRFETHAMHHPGSYICRQLCHMCMQWFSAWQVPMYACVMLQLKHHPAMHKHSSSGDSGRTFEVVCVIQEHVEQSLELACQQQFLGQAQRAAICQAAVKTLQGSTPPSSPLASPRHSGDSSVHMSLVHLKHDSPFQHSRLG